MLSYYLPSCQYIIYLYTHYLRLVKGPNLKATAGPESRYTTITPRPATSRVLPRGLPWVVHVTAGNARTGTALALYPHMQDSCQCPSVTVGNTATNATLEIRRVPVPALPLPWVAFLAPRNRDAANVTTGATDGAVGVLPGGHVYCVPDALARALPMVVRPRPGPSGAVRGWHGVCILRGTAAQLAPSGPPALAGSVRHGRAGAGQINRGFAP